MGSNSKPAPKPTAKKPAPAPAPKAVAKKTAPAPKAVAKKPAPTPKPAAKKPASKPEPPPLVVEIDGRALGSAEGEEVWRAFSAHMDEHQGDLAGFAKLRGWKSVAPTYRRGSAVLLVATR